MKEADPSAEVSRELPSSPNGLREADGGAGVVPEIDSRSVRVISGSPTELP